MDFSGRVPMEILLIDFAQRWRSWEGCCRKQTNSKPYLLLTPGSLCLPLSWLISISPSECLICCWPPCLSPTSWCWPSCWPTSSLMPFCCSPAFWPPCLCPMCGCCSLKSIYWLIFECVSGQSSYFSCNVASLFWRQDLSGILRNLHLFELILPITKS